MSKQLLLFDPPNPSVGAGSLESHRCAETPGDSQHSGEHGQSFTDSIACDQNQGDGQ